MWGYVLRRIIYAFPIVIGVNIITFALFFLINSPDQMAQAQLGIKHITPEAVRQWKEQRGYHLPLFVNKELSGTEAMTETIFFQKSAKLFTFEFGKSDEGRLIGEEIKKRMWPSLAVALPVFAIGLAVNISLALLVVMFRASMFELVAMIFCVGMFSISSMFYIIGGQFLAGKLWHLVPVSGYLPGVAAVKFLILPIAIGVITGIGGGVRIYRIIFLEEANRDYIRTARAKGVSEFSILFKHMLPNGLIPILTGIVVVIPVLFLGSLVTESFFGIPGLGSFTIDGIRAQDFSIVRTMVFLSSVLYIIGLLLTDISYTLVDPRVRLQ